MRIVWLIALLIAPIYSRDVVSKVYFHLTISCRHIFQDYFPFNVHFFKVLNVFVNSAISERYKFRQVPGGGQVSDIYEGTVIGPEGSEYTTMVNIQHKCGASQIPNNNIIYFTGTCKIKPATPCHIYHSIELGNKNWPVTETPRIEQ